MPVRKHYKVDNFLAQLHYRQQTTIISFFLQRPSTVSFVQETP